MAGNPLDPRTPAGTRAYINTQTNAAVAPERLAIQAAQKAAQREALAQQQRIIGFAQAAAAQLQQGVPQTEAAYHQAVTDQQGLASGFSQQMRDRLAGVPGAPAGAADATYNLGGVIPGNRLSADAVAQLGLAQSQPATQLGLGQVGLRGSAYQAQQQGQKFPDAQAALAAKIPGIRAQIASQVGAEERSKIAEKTSLDKVDATWRQEYARLYGFDPKTGRPTLASQKQAAELYGTGPDGQPTVAQKRLNQASAKAKASGQQVDQAKSKDTGTIYLKNGKKWINPDTGKPQKIVKSASGSGGTYAERHPIDALRKSASSEVDNILSKAKFQKNNPSSTVKTGDPQVDALINSLAGSSSTGGPPDIAEIVADVLQTTDAIAVGTKAGLSPGRVKQMMRKIVVAKLRAVGYNVGKKK